MERCRHVGVAQDGNDVVFMDGNDSSCLLVAAEIFCSKSGRLSILFRYTLPFGHQDQALSKFLILLLQLTLAFP